MRRALFLSPAQMHAIPSADLIRAREFIIKTETISKLTGKGFLDRPWRKDRLELIELELRARDPRRHSFNTK